MHVVFCKIDQCVCLLVCLPGFSLRAHFTHSAHGCELPVLKLLFSLLAVKLQNTSVPSPPSRDKVLPNELYLCMTWQVFVSDCLLLYSCCDDCPFIFPYFKQRKKKSRVTYTSTYFLLYFPRKVFKLKKKRYLFEILGGKCSGLLRSDV